MKLPPQKTYPVDEKSFSSFYQIFYQFFFTGSKQQIKFPEQREVIPALAINWLARIKNIGNVAQLGDYEKRKLRVFNLLNFLQLITGIMMPVIVYLNNPTFTAGNMLLSSTPALISGLVLFLNYSKKHEEARISYFLLYPVFTSFVYVGGLNLGIDLYFILYGILSVFFLQQIGQMLFAVSLSMISYYMLVVVLEFYPFRLAESQYFFFLFNQALAICFIFYGLFLIKKENNGYQFFILKRSEQLRLRNKEIERQKKVIAEKAILLQQQTRELEALNNLKNRLFSIIAHDLKAPMYALRNLFRSMQQEDMPAAEIKEMIPDIVNDLNYTTSLMDNLLQWAKSQMKADAVAPVRIELHHLLKEVIQIFRLQADQKNIRVVPHVAPGITAFADTDMLHLVLRNIISNAVKFTPAGGSIHINASQTSGFVEIAVTDTGVGIAPADLKKIREQVFFTTQGTARESGTGIGLMLCRDFLIKNGGRLHIDSEADKGSTISIILPASS